MSTAHGIRKICRNGRYLADHAPIRPVRSNLDLRKPLFLRVKPAITILAAGYAHTIRIRLNSVTGWRQARVASRSLWLTEINHLDGIGKPAFSRASAPLTAVNRCRGWALRNGSRRLHRGRRIWRIWKAGSVLSARLPRARRTPGFWRLPWCPWWSPLRSRKVRARCRQTSAARCRSWLPSCWSISEVRALVVRDGAVFRMASTGTRSSFRMRLPMSLVLPGEGLAEMGRSRSWHGRDTPCRPTNSRVISGWVSGSSATGPVHSIGTIDRHLRWRRLQFVMWG